MELALPSISKLIPSQFMNLVSALSLVTALLERCNWWNSAVVQLQSSSPISTGSCFLSSLKVYSSHPASFSSLFIHALISSSVLTSLFIAFIKVPYLPAKQDE